MFEYLKGELVLKRPTHVVIDVNGVGYRVQVPATTSRALPERGPVKIWTYSRISEEELRLFGFATEEERNLFELIVESVPMLGPSKALLIFSNISGEQLLSAVKKGDVGLLKRIKGIGDKLATRMIVELRGKLPAASGPEPASIVNEAILGLVSLGYTRQEAAAAVEKAAKEADGASLEELIKRSLQYV